jgi:hypothetical protein
MQSEDTLASIWMGLGLAFSVEIWWGGGGIDGN